MNYNNFNNNNGPVIYQNSFSGIMNKVYGIMFLGLLITAGVALYVASDVNLARMFVGNYTAPIILGIIEFAMVIYLSSRALEMSHGKAITMFLIYSALNGLTFSIVFLAFNIGAIYMAFFAAATTFAVMSAYGYFTKSDLTGVGKILFVALIALIVMSIINIFMRNSQFDMLISYAGVVIFLGLTAYDTQKIKEIYQQAPHQNIAVIGALRLYLDFVNLFIFLLRIFGGNRD